LAQLADPLDDWYCPSPHGLHALAPAAENFPAGQASAANEAWPVDEHA
jgi:hypothetical protein